MDELWTMDYTADEMVARASEAEWVSQGYFRAHVRLHKFDWLDVFPEGITAEEYDAIKDAAIRDPQAHIFAFSYEGQPQWGFLCETLLFAGKRLRNVAVIYDLKTDAITNCHIAYKGIKYFVSKTRSRRIR